MLNSKEVTVQTIDWARTGLAILLAPLAAPLAVIACILRFQTQYSRDLLSGTAIAGALAQSVVYSLPLAYLVTALVGLPAMLILRAYRLQSIYFYALVGAFVGMVTVHLYSALFYASLSDWLEYLLHAKRWLNLPTCSGFGAGAFTGIVFGSLASRGLRPPERPVL